MLMEKINNFLRDFADLPVEINIKVKDEEELDEPVDVDLLLLPIQDYLVKQMINLYIELLKIRI